VNKFNGKNSYNNRVSVDYRRKTVFFKPIKGDWTETTPYRMLVIQIFSFLALIGVPALLVVFCLIAFNGQYNDKLWVGIYFIYCGLCLLYAWFLSLPYIVSKKWRENEFPKFNYWVLNYLSKFSKKNGTRNKTIKPENVLSNKIFVPHFQNVMFKYRSVGDFSKIKNINIINSFEDDPLNWCCCIELERKPKKGFMEITYM